MDLLIGLGRGRPFHSQPIQESRASPLPSGAKDSEGCYFFPVWDEFQELEKVERFSEEPL
jgi:hypothetical protein